MQAMSVSPANSPRRWRGTGGHTGAALQWSASHRRRTRAPRALRERADTRAADLIQRPWQLGRHPVGCGCGSQTAVMRENAAAIVAGVVPANVKKPASRRDEVALTYISVLVSGYSIYNDCN